ncbi:MAG: dihydrofolate reductase [Ktedonobacteraceae bacterium]|nr:dihydrofolate reductase [Ktedonobacteraceae bacterium]
MVSIIVAYAHGHVIGRDGKIPWHLPNDSNYFKRITTGHTVVMGRKTFASIGRPLPQRRNIVLTHDHDMRLAGVEVVHSKQEVLALDDAFIIGGEAVYRQFIDIADRLYITEIALDVEGDTFFPAWNPQDFMLVSEQEGMLDEKNTLPHTFYVYERKKLRDC